MAKDYIGIFDIFGPIMIGPSSSHTAGVARIAFLAQKIFQSPIAKARISFYGSLACTYRGHGSDRAVLAGLLGVACDDERLSYGFELARKAGMDFEIVPVTKLPEKWHPNTLRLELESGDGKKLDLTGASVGGGNISIREIDGYRVDLSGEFEALLVLHHDERGVIATVSRILADNEINIASAVSHRKDRGDEALLIIEVDNPVKHAVIEQIDGIQAVYAVVYVPSVNS